MVSEIARQTSLGLDNEWTPAEAAPSPAGLLCWAKPAGTVPYAMIPNGIVDAPWDGVFWWTMANGQMQMLPATRATEHAAMLHHYRITAPLWAARTIALRAHEPRTEEANGSEQAHPFVSTVGAAWLIIGQPNLADTRTTEPVEAPKPATGPADSADTWERAPASVTIVDLRRAVAQSRSAGGKSRQYRNRSWVGWPNGFWRQQACGPGFSQRKPKLIAPYTKGPEDAPLVMKPRLNVWRR
jgi:hypothetical protein